MWNAFWSGFAATLGYKFANVAVALARQLLRFLLYGLLLVLGIYMLSRNETSVPVSQPVKEAATPEQRPAMPGKSSTATVPETIQTAAKLETTQPVVQISIDEQYLRRVDAECSGLDAMFCAERIRWQLCDGLWAEEPPPDHSICKGAAVSRQ
jgi:hypothetical protein